VHLQSRLKKTLLRVLDGDFFLFVHSDF
jgi:hypothetical protein